MYHTPELERKKKDKTRVLVVIKEKLMVNPSSSLKLTTVERAAGCGRGFWGGGAGAQN